MMISKGRIVKIHYKVTTEGKTVETTENRDPVSYVQGQKQLLPSVQKQLEGLKVGDKKDFELAPEETYGPHRPEAVEEIPRSEIPQWDKIKVGLVLQEKQADGRLKTGRVVEIKKDSAMLDFNHPMAGKRLTYAVEVVDVI